MPYKNIVYAKLQKRLLNDPRWFSMPDSCQLLYIKLLLAACETYNRVPKRIQIVRSLCRCRTKTARLLEHIEVIKAHFPKFKENLEHYYFEDFEENTNYIPGNIREIPRKSLGLPRDVVDKENSIVDKEKKKRKKFIPPTLEEVTAYCQERGNSVIPSAFINHYQTSEWVRGKTKIKDWKACVRTWENQDKPSNWHDEGGRL